ncbi:alpha/beta family hydrolase [Luteimicrobium sp. DT211]|uniref:alpha/beta hydrolase family protein n=1 Tax=Luteimicrobium sp. DT211 TaxID=3393412 RepID=UPI003CF062E2
MARATRLEVPTAQGPGELVLDRPAGAPRGVLMLGHGAGGGVDAPDLVAARDAALAAGLLVARFTQPYRVAGRRAPAPAVQLDAAWLEAVGVVRRRRGLRRLPLVVGGRSSGARVACRTALGAGAVGVVALAFPVHPPGKPERSRLGELDGAGVPALVVQGERDPFGCPPDASGRRVVVVPGADHALRCAEAVVAEAVTQFLESAHLA